MSEPKKSEIFRAAAEGVMRPWRPKLSPGFSGTFVFQPPDGEGHARAMQGMLNAIAEIYERLGD